MPIKNPIPYIAEHELAALNLSTTDIIKSIESLILMVKSEKAWAAPKATILPDDGRYMMAALAASDEPEILAVKTLVLNAKNTEQGLPQINGLVTLLNSQTGMPLAILDGNWITAVRTAALSATAAKAMALPNSSSIAFLGCGVQAQSHLDLFNDLFPLQQIHLFGRGQANIDTMRKKAEAYSLESTVHGSAKEAVKDADIVISSITYSPALTPFVKVTWLKSGVFAAITDLAVPWMKESFTALDNVIIDDLKQEAAAPNKLLRSELINGDLSQLVLGKANGRNSTIDKNAFIFRGHAMGDLALSILAYDTYQKQNSNM